MKKVIDMRKIEIGDVVCVMNDDGIPVLGKVDAIGNDRQGKYVETEETGNNRKYLGDVFSHYKSVAE